MALEFEEAPDYASILEREYQKINKGFERRESAEQANDKRRIQNAGVPLQLVEQLGAFSQTAFKAAQVAKQQSQKRQINFSDESGFSQEEIDLAINIYEKGDNLLLEDHKEKQKLAAKAEVEGEKYEALRLMTQSEWRKGRFGFLRQGVIYNDLAKLENNFFNLHPDFASYSIDEANNAVNKFGDDLLNGYNDLNYPQALVDLARQNLEKFRTTKHQEAIDSNLTRAKTNLEKENYLRVTGVFQAVDGPDFEKQVISFIEEFKTDEKFSGGLTRLLGYLTQGVQRGELTTTQARKIDDIFLKHYGKQGKLENIKDIHAKIFEASGWEDALHKADTEYINKEVQKIENQSKKAAVDYKTWSLDIIKTKGRFPTNDEKREFIEGFQKQGIDVPSTVLNGITEESKVQDKVVEELTDKFINSESISLNDLKGIEDPNVFAQWKNRVDTSDEWSLSSTDSNRIKTDFFKTRLEGHPEIATYTANDQAEVLNLAEGDLRIYFAEEYENEPNRAVALEKAKARVYTKIDNGHYQKLLNEGVPFDNTYSKKLQVAKEYVGTYPNKILTEVIPGSEKALEAAKKNPGETQLFYKQLMKNQKKVNGKYVSARDLQNAQLALVEGEKLIMSEFDKQIYELDNGKTLRLLKFHPDPARVLRAKISAFSDDEVIAYDEIDHLLPEAINVPMAQSGQEVIEEGVEAGYTHTLGTFEPRVGDWKELPGAFRIGYAVYDGENWVYSTTRNTEGQKYSGPINDFMDQDGYYKPFDGKSADLRTTFFGGDEPINKEGAPRPGEWYKTTNKGTDTPYVIWNGRDWVPSPVKGKFRKEFEGDREFDLRPEEEALIKQQAGM